MQIHSLTTTTSASFPLKTVFEYLSSEKIKAVAIACFQGCTNLCLCAFGMIELGQNFKKGESPEKLEATQNKVVKSSAAYLNLHGSLMLGSGTFGLMDALQGFGLVNFRNFAQAISTASNALFLCANLVALEENVRLLHELMTTDWSKTNISDQELKWMKQSAFWGLLSNLGYIVATASLLFGGITVATMLIAAVSCCFGGIKILFDVIAWAKAATL